MSKVVVKERGTGLYVGVRLSYGWYKKEKDLQSARVFENVTGARTMTRAKYKYVQAKPVELVFDELYEIVPVTIVPNA